MARVALGLFVAFHAMPNEEDNRGHHAGVRDEGDRPGRLRGKARATPGAARRRRTDDHRAHLHVGLAHRPGRPRPAGEPDPRPRGRGHRARGGFGGADVAAGRPGRVRRHHPRLGRSGRAERASVADRRAARRLQVRQHQGRRLRRVLPRQRGRRQPGEDPGRDSRRGGGVLRGHDVDRVHGRGARPHPDRRHGGRARPGPGGPHGDRGGPAVRRGPGHRDRVATTARTRSWTSAPRTWWSGCST
jgi:hypothetical protein